MKICQCPQITKQYDNISKKMFQAQMIKTKGRYVYKYSNSNTDNINQIIISQDYHRNKTLLFQISLVGYRNYYAPLARQYNLSNVLTAILNDLTQDEKNKLYCTTDPPVIPPPPVEIEGKTFYVMSRTVGSFTYFIFKNYSSDDFILPTYTYKFDYSDSSNSEKNTLLRFSFKRNGPELSSDYMSIDTENKVIKITLPYDTPYTEIFPYDDNQTNPYLKYYKTGYTVDSFYVKSTAFSQPIANDCTIYNPISIPNIYYFNNKSYELAYLTASSLAYIYEYKGPNLSIRDINSKERIQFLANKKFGLSLDASGNSRTYYLYVPQMYKLAILNTGQTDLISYTGDPNKVIRDQLVIGTEANDLYDFYYGTIQITVKGIFQPVSIYTLDYGYLHAKHLLVYAENPDTTFDSNPYILPY